MLVRGSTPPKAVSSTPSFQFQAFIELTRIKKFAGTLVLFWPYAWSLTLLAHQINLKVFSAKYNWLLLYGFIGACLAHSAGCVWNDVLDREIDRKVERTKKRPLADKRVSVPGALAFLAIHILLLLGMLWRTSTLVWRVSLLSFFVLAGIYPLMKRITNWPQAWLGLAMGCGVPLASIALHEAITPSIKYLYLASWAWTIYYDTVYACQDKKDDAQAGVRSTALLFGNYIKPILSAFGISLLLLLVTSGRMEGAGHGFYLIILGGGSLFIFHGLYYTDFDDPRKCYDLFRQNAYYFGPIVFAGMLF